MKNTFKRIAVIALAVLMCVSSVVPAFAAGNACPGTGNTHTKYNCTYVEANKQEATCTEPGFVTGKCTTCNAVFSVSQTEALGHDWDAVVPAVCGYSATRTCKRCGTEDAIAGTKLDHLYTAWTLTEGTCEPGARVTKTCVYCGDAHKESPKKLGDEGHEFVLVSYALPVFCKDKGVAKYECVVAGCDATKTVEIENDATDHDWDEVPVAKDDEYEKATCTETGRKTMACKLCDAEVVVSIPKAKCELKEVAEKKPTCTTAGNYKYYQCYECSTCYDDAEGKNKVELADQKRPAIHDTLTTDPKYIVKEFLPTCEFDGYIRYACNEEGCKESGQITLTKFTSHLYYNDVKTLAQKTDLLNALYNNKDYTKGKSEAWVENEWAKLGELKVSQVLNEETTDVLDDYKTVYGPGEGLVWKDFVPANCAENAKVTYLCLNCAYSYTSGAYQPAKCVSVPTVLEGEGFDKLEHAFADRYPASNKVNAGQAYKDVEDLTVSCDDPGMRTYFCINEYQDKTGALVACPGVTAKNVDKLGHKYTALTAENVDDDVTNYKLDGSDISASELKTEITSNVITCLKDDGKTYEVCSVCNAVKSTKVVGTGDEHDWTYFDAKGNPVELDTEYDKFSCTEELKGYNRSCKNEGCKEFENMKPTTIPARGHKYPDTNDAKFLKEIVTLEKSGDAKYYDEDNKYLKVKLVTPGSCENGATYALGCEKCKIPKSFEINEGFGGGHVKTYIPNSAIAATCNAPGYSNKWYCADEDCKFYGFVDTDGKLLNVHQAEINVDDDLKGDVKYGATHNIWNAKKEDFVPVTHKNVPDVAISGCDSFDEAKKVEAPVVDGKVVNYVAIEGTSLIWVYKYMPENADHTVTTVTTGGFYCVDCGMGVTGFAADIDFGTTHEEEGFASNTKLSLDRTCENVGYKFYTCKGENCFVGYIDTFVKAKDHKFTFVEKDEDGKFVVLEDKWKDEYKEDGLNYVKPTCTTAGYAIDKCTLGCDKVVTVSIKANGHINEKGDELTTSCLNTAYPRKCDKCGVTVNKAHAYNEAGICQQCGETK